MCTAKNETILCFLINETMPSFPCLGPKRRVAAIFGMRNAVDFSLSMTSLSRAQRRRAAGLGMKDAVKVLVSAGAGLRNKDCGGMTASELAVCMGYESVFEMLEGVPVAYGDLGQEARALKEGLSGGGGGGGMEGGEGRKRGASESGEADEKVQVFEDVGLGCVDNKASAGIEDRASREEVTAREPAIIEGVTARELAGKEEVSARGPASRDETTLGGADDLATAVRAETAEEPATQEEEPAEIVKDSEATDKAEADNVPRGEKKKKKKKK